MQNVLLISIEIFVKNFKIIRKNYKEHLCEVRYIENKRGSKIKAITKSPEMTDKIYLHALLKFIKYIQSVFTSFISNIFFFLNFAFVILILPK